MTMMRMMLMSDYGVAILLSRPILVLVSCVRVSGGRGYGCTRTVLATARLCTACVYEQFQIEIQCQS